MSDRVTGAALRDRWRAIPLAWLTVAFTVAQMADLVSGSAVARELNPIAASIAAQPILRARTQAGSGRIGGRHGCDLRSSAPGAGQAGAQHRRPRRRFSAP